MKEFFSDFLGILSGCILVICLAFCSFLLISNFFHFKDISYKYQVDVKDNMDYKDYVRIINDATLKMKSVSTSSNSAAKPIYSYYSSCVSKLNNSTFNKLANKDYITSLDVYNANMEILNTYNNSCMFYIPYNINLMYKNKSNSFKTVNDQIEQKNSIILDNAEYLTKSGLGNSSYSFVTDMTKSTIYNKTKNEFNLTIDNYKMIAYILDDIANWYVDEFGGSR